MTMVRDDNLHSIVSKVMVTAENIVNSDANILEFGIQSHFDAEAWEWYVVLTFEGDEEKSYAFTVEQAKQWIPVLAHTIQFTNDTNFVTFARMIAKHFAACIKEIENSAIVGVSVLRRKDEE
jgi:hypothetical protein